MSLTHEITIRIWCDQCHAWEQTSRSAHAFRKELKERGWTAVDAFGMKDYCQKCSIERAKILKELKENLGKHDLSCSYRQTRGHESCNCGVEHEKKE